MKRYIIPFVSLALSGLLFADNHSQLLFNGKDLTGWQDRNGNASMGITPEGKVGLTGAKEAANTFESALTAATETCASMLRIDQVVSARGD